MANTRDCVAALGDLVSARRGSASSACILPGAKEAPMRTYVHWTTKEIRLLKVMHKAHVPSYKELIAAFPRHSVDGILNVAKIHNLRPKQRDWMKIAKQYSIERGDKALVRA
jgi:hypothetical protein